jgi:hypothetical protein
VKGEKMPHMQEAWYHLKPFVQKALDSGIRYDDELVKIVIHSVGENML